MSGKFARRIRGGSSYLLWAKTVIVLALAVSLLAQLPVNLGHVAKAQSSNGFTFTASGDFGDLSSGDSLNSLKSLGSSGVDFFLGLGDMSVNNSLTGNVWCGAATLVR